MPLLLLYLVPLPCLYLMPLLLLQVLSERVLRGCCVRVGVLRGDGVGGRGVGVRVGVGRG